MNKLIKYKILFAANLTIAGVLIGFILATNLTGTKLVLALLMTLGGYLGAIAMYIEMRRIKKQSS
jgi:hypothetical protein